MGKLNDSRRRCDKAGEARPEQTVFVGVVGFSAKNAARRGVSAWVKTFVHFFMATDSKMLQPFIVGSSTGNNLPRMDAVRGIAVACVVVFHTWVLSGQPPIRLSGPHDSGIDLTPFFSSGAAGVDLFFVLSGFLLSQYWLRADFLKKSRPSLRLYARHRIFRIVPAYYGCLFLMLLLLCPTLIPVDFVYSRLGAFMLVSHLLFVQHLFPVTSGSYTVNGSLWTLTIEAMFYGVLPWMVLLFMRNRWLISLPVLTAITLLWLYFCDQSMGPFVHFLQGTVSRWKISEFIIRRYLARQFPAQLVDFGLGIVLANIYVQDCLGTNTGRLFQIATKRWMGTLYFVVGWVIVLGSMELATVSPVLFGYYLRQISVSAGFTLVMAGLLFGGVGVGRLFEFAPLRLVGLIGYSAYLWHLPLIYLIASFPGIAGLPPGQRFPHMLWHVWLAVMVLSILSFLTVEKPFMVLGRRPNARGDIRSAGVGAEGRALDPMRVHTPVGESYLAGISSSAEDREN